jgi:hypothetical protein
MKTQTSFDWFSTLSLAATLVLAADSIPAQEITATATAATAQPAPLLSYGVDQIIQLSQAKVSEATIVNFIQNSGSSYGLDANQIVYLKQQGVSDNVINTMLSQPHLTSVAAPPPPPSATATATVNVYNTQPETAAYQVPPIYVNSPSVYVIPDTQTSRYYAYSYNPYYGGRHYLGLSYQPYYFGSYIYYGPRPYYGNRPNYYNNRVTVFGQGGVNGGGGHYRGGWHR